MKSCRIEYVVKLCLILLFFLQASCNAQPADEPLIFHLHFKDGKRSCLVGIHHVAIVAAKDTPELIDCAAHASAVAVEADINKGPSTFLSLYEKRAGEFGVERLASSTVRKLRPALKAARLSDTEIDYVLTNLHPAGIYRTLLTAKLLDGDTKFVANLDIAFMKGAAALNIKLFEIEGYENLRRSELDIELKDLDALISALADFYLDADRLNKALLKANEFGRSLSAQPNVDSSLQRKYFFNSEILGLPPFSVHYEVVKRNPLMVDGLLRAVETQGQLIVFVGASHIGGEHGMLELLRQKGVKVTRIK
jgi:uncharacterized protein YbaP (TraB family)